MMNQSKVMNAAIPYRDADEFYAINENCCRFGPTGIDGFSGSFWARVQGKQSEFFVAEYWIRYEDESGIIRSQLSKADMVSVSNCGEATSSFD